jgi:four helix bundle protein
MGNYVYSGAQTETFRHLPGFKNTVAWQAASDLTALVNQLVTPFGPAQYRLANHMRGAAISVAANIAEGYASGSLPNYLRYCNHARGSLAELGSYLQDCERTSLATSDALQRLLRQYSVTTYLLDRLIQGLIKKELSGPWDNKHQIKEAPAEYSPVAPTTPLPPTDDLALYAHIGTADDPDLTELPDLPAP